MRSLACRVACLVAVLLAALTSCTSITVRPLPAGVRDVAIRTNPKVTVPKFLHLLEGAFRERAISTRVIGETDATHADCIVTYTARRSWDLATYLSEAEIWVHRDGREVAYANYNLVGKGGLSLYKWASVESKMAPVFEQFFVNYPMATPREPRPEERGPGWRRWP